MANYFVECSRQQCARAVSGQEVLLLLELNKLDNTTIGRPRKLERQLSTKKDPHPMLESLDYL